MDTPWRMGRILVPPWSHGGVGLKIKIQIFRFCHTDDSKRKRKSGGNERRGNKTKNSNRPHHHRTSACCWSRTITPSGVCHCTGVCVCECECVWRVCVDDRPKALLTRAIVYVICSAAGRTRMLGWLVFSLCLLFFTCKWKQCLVVPAGIWGDHERQRKREKKRKKQKRKSIFRLQQHGS